MKWTARLCNQSGGEIERVEADTVNELRAKAGKLMLLIDDGDTIEVTLDEDDGEGDEKLPESDPGRERFGSDHGL